MYKEICFNSPFKTINPSQDWQFSINVIYNIVTNFNETDDLKSFHLDDKKYNQIKRNETHTKKQSQVKTCQGCVSFKMYKLTYVISHI